MGLQTSGQRTKVHPCPEPTLFPQQKRTPDEHSSAFPFITLIIAPNHSSHLCLLLLPSRCHTVLWGHHVAPFENHGFQEKSSNTEAYTCAGAHTQHFYTPLGLCWFRTQGKL